MFWKPSFSSIARPFGKMIGLCTLAVLCSSSSSTDKKPSNQEALILKKITHYWKEGSFDIVKTQISTYLQKYPQSSAAEELLACLGDIYLKEKNYFAALEQYKQITSPALCNKVSYNKVICCYELKNFQAAIDEAQSFLQKEDPSALDVPTVRLFLAESLYRLSMEESHKQDLEKLLADALEEYEKLSHTSLQKYSLVPLVDIYEKQKNYRKAAETSLQLAEMSPSRKEDYLYQAACLQANYSPKEAIRSFDKIYSLGGKKASSAAYNHILLLYKNKQYKNLLLANEKMGKYVPSDRAAIVHFLVGESLVHINQFGEAAHRFTSSLKETGLDPVQRSNALHQLLLCAYKAQSLSLFDEYFRLSKEENNSSDAALALVLHAQLCVEKKENTKALTSFSLLFDTFPSYKLSEPALYNYGLALYNEKKLDDSEQVFLSLIHSFPSSTLLSSAWDYCLAIHLDQLRQSPSETKHIRKEQLVSFLKTLLTENTTLSNETRKKHHLLLVKTLIDLQKKEEAAADMQRYLSLYTSGPNSAEAYLLLANCYQGNKDTLGTFVLHAEKALEQNANIDKEGTLCLHLYNAYLSLSEKAKEEEKASLLEKAAHHLFSSLTRKKDTLQKSNIQWLADYYYQQIKMHQISGSELEQKIDQAIFACKTLLQIDSLSEEPTTLQLGELLTLAGRSREKIEFLSKMAEKHKLSKAEDSKWSRHIELELARTYQLQNQNDDALALYEKIIATSPHCLSYVTQAAQLERAKLQFALLPKEERSLSNSCCQTILSDLNEVEINRNLCSEPLHLDAALSYVEIKTALMAPVQRQQGRLDLLQRARESFTTENDPSYLAEKDLLGDKWHVYNLYVKFIDANIKKIEAELDLKQGNTDSAQKLMHEARLELENLKQEKLLPSRLHSLLTTDPSGEEGET